MGLELTTEKELMFNYYHRILISDGSKGFLLKTVLQFLQRIPDAVIADTRRNVSYYREWMNHQQYFVPRREILFLKQSRQGPHPDPGQSFVNCLKFSLLRNAVFLAIVAK